MPRKTTRAANGSGSLRKRSDGTWEARYVVGYDADGNIVRKSVYGKTQKDVREKLTKATHEIDTHDYFEPSKITLGQWLDTWTAEYLDSIKYLTAKQYKAQVKTHIKPALGNIKLAELTPDQIKKFYNKLQKEGRTVPKRDEDGKIIKDKDGKTETETAPLSAKSIRNVHGILTKCLSVAVDMGYIRSNPATRLSDKLPRNEKKEIHPLTDEQVKQFVKELDGEEYKRLFQAILFMGLREADASGLTWDCVDFNAGTVTIKQQLVKRPQKDGGFTISPTKNSKERIIAPAPFVMDILKQRRAEQAEQRIAAGDAWEGWKSLKERDKYFCFTTVTGHNLSPQTIYNHYKKIAERIGAADTCVHDLRHTYATISLQNGDDVKTVQENLGHYSAAFTLDVYGHVSEKMRKESSERMQRYIEGIS